MRDRVVFRKFNYRHEAEIVRELLEANGIEAFVTSNDCGALDPALQLAQGAVLWIAADELENARSVVG